MFCGLVLFAAFVALLYLAQRRRWMKTRETRSCRRSQRIARQARPGRGVSGGRASHRDGLGLEWQRTRNPRRSRPRQRYAGRAPDPRIRLLAAARASAGSRSQSQESARARSGVPAIRREPQRPQYRHRGPCRHGPRRHAHPRRVGRPARSGSPQREPICVSYKSAMRFKTLLDAIPSPAWMRDGAGQFVWVNRAYAIAVEAGDARDAASRGDRAFGNLDARRGRQQTPRE